MQQHKATPLGARLKELRTQRGISLRGVAEAAGVDDSLLSRIETGRVAKPTQQNLNRLAAFYDIDPEELWVLASYHISTRLPGVGAYFRSRYHLPDEAVHEMENFLGYIQKKYDTEDSSGTEGLTPPKTTAT